nr:Hsp20/alpha crystallin family protein [Desulfurispira natronophila]
MNLFYEELQARDRSGAWDYTHSWQPAVDIIACSKCYTVDISLPGVAVGSITLEINDNTLYVSGKRNSCSNAALTCLRLEREQGDFFRAIELERPICEQSISTEHLDGILRIVLQHK